MKSSINRYPPAVCFLLPAIVLIAGCAYPEDHPPAPPGRDTSFIASPSIDHTLSKPDLLVPKSGVIETGKTRPEDLVQYASTLIGVPYLYACTDPAKGVDCSGFITHVFNHFNIAVPRSSVDFTNVGREVDTTQARPGDLILFTGTDSTIRTVGHMGLVVSNENGKLRFIHSSSGKAKGVVFSPLERYYRGRFVKVIRVFPEEAWN